MNSPIPFMDFANVIGTKYLKAMTQRMVISTFMFLFGLIPVYSTEAGKNCIDVHSCCSNSSRRWNDRGYYVHSDDSYSCVRCSYTRNVEFPQERTLSSSAGAIVGYAIGCTVFGILVVLRLIICCVRCGSNDAVYPINV